ncbi:MAG: hypothetical protein ACLU3N_07020 [Lachnospiraceae bacterium]
MKIQKAGYEILTPISEGGVKELQHIGGLEEYVINQKIRSQRTARVQKSS